MSLWSDLLKAKAAELQAAPAQTSAPAEQPGPEPRWVRQGGRMHAVFAATAAEFRAACRDVRFREDSEIQPMYRAMLERMRQLKAQQEFRS